MIKVKWNSSFYFAPLVIPILVLIILPLQTSFEFEQNLLALQTGIISTEDQDYAISNDFSVRILHDGKLMRISGLTTTDETFYLYQTTVGEKISINGKIYSEGKFKPIVLREQIQEQKPTVVKKSDLIMAVKLSKYTYANYPFTIGVKVFDAKKNPEAVFDQSYGIRENIPVTVTITNQKGEAVTKLSGTTDKTGLFNAKYLVKAGIVSQGEYDVKVTINGFEDTSQSFKTFFRGDIRDYFHNTN